MPVSAENQGKSTTKRAVSIIRPQKVLTKATLKIRLCRTLDQTLTFLNPMSSEYCLKHRLHMFKPYFLIIPWELLHSRQERDPGPNLRG